MALYRISYIVNCTFYILHPTFYILHPTSYILHRKLYLVSFTPIFHPTTWLRNFAGAPISVSLAYLVSFTPQNGCAILRGPRSFYPKNSPCSFLGPRSPFRWCISCLRHVLVIAPLLRRQSLEKTLGKYSILAPY